MAIEKSRSVFVALGVIVLVLSTSGCALYEDLEPIDSSEVPVETVTIAPESARVQIGDSTQLSATVRGPNDVELEDRTVEWMSSNPDKATVTSAGLVEGVSEGTVTITAQVDDVSATAQIDVFVPIESVTLEPTEANIEVGQTQQFTATVTDVEGGQVDASIVEWSSSQEDVASVDDSGLVEALKEGTTTITASAEGVSATATVTVTASVADVEVTPNPAQVGLGETTQLTATLTDANGNELTGRDVDWSSDDESIATVNSNGIVSAVSEGDVDITATSEGESGTALVQVTRPVASVTVSPDPITLDVAETEQLSATARDANGDEIQLSPDQFTWRSADSGIATVTGTGEVEGVGEGTTEITAEVDGQSGSSQVTVNRPVVSIEISPSSTSVEVNTTVQLTATLLDANDDVITGRPVNWSSSDPNVATVDSSGVVTGVQEGDVVITARAEGVNATANVSVGAPVATVDISPDGGAIDVGQTLQLDATIQDAGGNDLSRSVTWTSSAPGVVSVNQTGLATGQSQGTADITAESEGVSDTVSVTVSAPVDSVTVTPDPVNLDLNDTQQLDVELQDANGNVLTGRTVNWSSNAPGIASVDNSGLVTAVAEGTTQVTATSEGVSDSVSVTVTASVDDVVVSPGSVRIWSDEQTQLSVDVLDANGDPLTGRSVTWSSDDSAVATVDTNGMVSAVGPGVCNISATSEGVSGTMTLTVVEWGYVDAGQRFTCGVLTDGEAYCWGENDEGEVGSGTTGGQFTTPQLVSGNHDFTTLSSGFFHNCGVTTGQDIYCWGNNANAALGDGTANSSNIPVKVSGAFSWSQVSAGANHTCARTTSNDAYCWGVNQQGQLGDGNGNVNGSGDSTIPKAVSGGFSFTDIASGLSHTCGVTSSGDMYCWGENADGQLGIGSTSQLLAPTTAVSGSQTWVDVSAGSAHTCGTTTTGKVYCWGANNNGQLGRDPNTTTNSNTPIEVTISGASLDTVELGFGYSCAITSNSDAYCWGFNGQGNFGNGGANATQFTPVQVGGGFDWSVMGAGLQHTCGINQLVDAYCFGDNDNGEIGLGTTSNVEFSPKAVSRPSL
jgi:uncharacterized protein YjdB